MSGTISTPSNLMATEIVDNTSGAIAPANVRDVVETLAAAPTSVKTTAYTAALVDRGTLIEMNSTNSPASTINFTIPPNSSVAFPIGAVMTVCQLGADQVTLVAGSGVTIRTPSSLTARAQYSTVGVRKRATDEWVAFGDLT